MKMGGRAWYSMIKEFGVSPIVRNKRQAHIRTSFAMRHRLGDASESHLAVQSLLSVALPLRRGKIHGAATGYERTRTIEILRRILRPLVSSL